MAALSRCRSAVRCTRTNLAGNPFEIINGPDGLLWVTERNAGKVTKFDPEDGTKTTILTVDEVVATPGEQDGLLGMALHPDLLKGNRSKNNNTKMKNQYVYLSYTVDADPGAESDRRQKLVRYTYDAAATQLVKPEGTDLGRARQRRPQLRTPGLRSG